MTTKTLKAAPEPKYKKLYSEAKRTIASLELEIEVLKDKVYHISNMVLSGTVGDVAIQSGQLEISVPKHVAQWMIEYQLPWQVFRCEEHGLWIDELDSSFPYHMECSKCPKC